MKTPLQQDLERVAIYRMVGFPFIMPIANKWSGNWDKAKGEIELHVNRFLDKQYENVIFFLETEPTREELFKSVLSTIYSDFFLIGYKREQAALEWLKRAFSKASWVGDLEWEDENRGFDIITKDRSIAISVKGWHFSNKNNWKYRQHKHKLTQASEEYVAIAYVDLKKRKIRVEYVKGGNQWIRTLKTEEKI